MAYKRNQKGRLTIVTFLLRVVQLLFAFLLVMMAIGNCNDQGWDVFQFNTKNVHIAIYSIKIFILCMMAFGLFDIAIKQHCEQFRKKLLIFSLLNIFLALGELVIVILIGSGSLNVNTDFNYQITYIFEIVVFISMTIVCGYLRHCELQILFNIGHYKNLDDMTDKEMFAEYDKMRKVSYIMKRKKKRAQGDGYDRDSKQRTSINAIPNSSDKILPNSLSEVSIEAAN